MTPAHYLSIHLPGFDRVVQIGAAWFDDHLLEIPSNRAGLIGNNVRLDAVAPKKEIESRPVIDLSMLHAIGRPCHSVYNYQIMHLCIAPRISAL